MHEEFADRVVVVTGASSGIGRATAELFLAAGSFVALFARSGEVLDGIARQAGPRALAIAGDAAAESDVDALFTAVEERFGDCDVLVNCAGMVDPKPLHETAPESWDRMFAVNVRGTYLTCRRALPSMLARRSGAIVNVASISGVVGPEKFPGFVSYCASKGAVISLTEALAVEVRGHGVRVNCVSPGSVATEMWARVSGGAPADMTPAEVASVIAFLASAGSRPMNGQNARLW